MLTVFREHPGTALVGNALVALATFVIFYLMTVFALSWGTTALGYGREKFLVMQLFAILFFAIFIPIMARSSPSAGRRSTLLCDRGHRRIRTDYGAHVSRRDDGSRADDDGGPFPDGLDPPARWARCCPSCFRPRCGIPEAR